jgi:hypothetical protein
MSRNIETIATSGAAGFYERSGFEARPADHPGLWLRI